LVIDDVTVCSRIWLLVFANRIHIISLKNTII
jgi:hypothetical protein